MAKTQIVLSSNPYYYNKEADSYILINHSLVREDTITRYKNKYSVIDYLPSVEEYAKLKQYVVNLSLKYIECYKNSLEDMFDIRISKNQLNIYWGNWLQTFIADIYIRYEYIKRIEENDAYACYNIHDDFARDWRQYGSLSEYSSEYNSLIFAKLLSCIGFDVRTKAGIDFYTIKENFIKEVSKNINRIKRYANAPKKLKNKLDNNKIQSEIVIPNDYDVLIVQSRMPKTMEKNIAAGCNKKLYFVEDVLFRTRMQSLMKGVSGDHERRLRFFSKFTSDDDFEKLLDVMVATFIPKTFFEGMGVMYKEAEKLCKDWNYKKIYHSACMEEIFLLCAGIMKERGCLISDIQHSAVYGNVYFFGFTEYSLYDRFCTWGWKPSGIPYNNIRNVAMSRIPQKADDKRIVKKDKILLACNNPELSIGGRGWSYLKYTIRQKEFIDNLSEECRKQLVIRTDVTKSQSDLEIWCKKKYPYIKFESRFEISFTDSVRESKLLVCDYYGSPHVEALLLDCPFVIFNAAQLISSNIGLHDILTRMKKIGIYCDDGIEMAGIISEKINDIGGWMNQEEVKNVLREYKMKSHALIKI